MGLKLLKQAINNINQSVHHSLESVNTPKNKVIRALLQELQTKKFINEITETQTKYLFSYNKTLNKLIVIDPLLYPSSKKEVSKLNKQYASLKGYLILTNPQFKIHSYNSEILEGGKVICYVY